MSIPSATLLMVEDDPEISRLVRDFMRREGFEIEVAENAAAMDAVLRRLRPDLIILDLMLPGEDGLSICRRLRQSDDIPILMLSAKSDEIDRVVGLELGADDYMVKPFGPRELLARVRALLRRAQASPRREASRRFAFDRFVLDVDARSIETVSGGDAQIQLTSAEFDLLACFVQRPRRVLSRDQILDFTRGRSAEPFDRTVDMLISRLRRKLEAASPGTSLITTVRNGGYLFTAIVRPVAG
ncbi:MULTISPECIES: response regulator [Bradyrhizobium]|jgi:two-component system OmpR family response regulator|uniref:response regulator n=2 Tax=Nitrobacteraceae TaxID=41294 RepID=UPI0003A94798|nr:response regulator transcription factor [Bradyrhizobium denitrificans]MCL8484577.1 response regulator transcription factor [Bradyrhizobium denitrificans]RTL98517.1 MAG: response regulator transcription factor [Bradyrhizobiaceae bacterium]